MAASSSDLFSSRCFHFSSRSASSIGLASRHVIRKTLRPRIALLASAPTVFGAMNWTRGTIWRAAVALRSRPAVSGSACSPELASSVRAARAEASLSSHSYSCYQAGVCLLALLTPAQRVLPLPLLPTVITLPFPLILPVVALRLHRSSSRKSVLRCTQIAAPIAAPIPATRPAPAATNGTQTVAAMLILKSSVPDTLVPTGHRFPRAEVR